MATQADGTLGFAETEHGLFFSASIRRQELVDIVLDAATLRTLRGVSVGPGPFRSVRWDSGVRVVEDAPLLEISLCVGSVFPKFSGTWAKVDGIERAA
jgi:phage head maturation protease